jgi:hypothetical protein
MPGLLAIGKRNNYEGDGGHENQEAYKALLGNDHGRTARGDEAIDQEFVGDKAQPLSKEMKARWVRAKAKGTSVANGSTEAHIAVRLDKSLLMRCNALAKKKRLSRDTLIARGLRALLAAEGE